MFDQENIAKINDATKDIRAKLDCPDFPVREFKSHTMMHIPALYMDDTRLSVCFVDEDFVEDMSNEEIVDLFKERAIQALKCRISISEDAIAKLQ